MFGNNKTKGHKQDGQNRIRSLLTKGGEPIGLRKTMYVHLKRSKMPKVARTN
jgi:hypothetical protein